jgi:hypothetical protein
MLGAGCGAGPATYNAAGKADPGGATGTKLNVVA